MAHKLTAERLRELLRYNPRTGVFIRKPGGAAVGVLHNKGYLKIEVDGQNYYAHRLAWLAHYGEWPKHQVDHRNRVRDDNRIRNLRDVTPSQQRMNSTTIWGASGVRGVSWNKRLRKWHAKIKRNYQQMHLGYFKSKAAAAKTYQAARKQLFGEFAPA